MTEPTSVAGLLPGGPVQIAYGVDDLVRAAHEFVALGAGPFFVSRHIPVSEVVVDGAPGADFDHSSAYGQWGAVMVELICVHGPDTLRRRGIHHVAHRVASFDATAAALVAAGWRNRLTARAGDVRFGMFEPPDLVGHPDEHPIGHLVEIYEPSPALDGFYAFIAAAARSWDGDDPVRELRPTARPATP